MVPLPRIKNLHAVKHTIGTRAQAANLACARCSHFGTTDRSQYRQAAGAVAQALVLDCSTRNDGKAHFVAEKASRQRGLRGRPRAKVQDTFFKLA
jgi:hypothetical protein